MDSFIDTVVKNLLQNHTSFEGIKLVVPGNRPKSFILQKFVQQGFQGILPSIISIEELFTDISGLRLISGVPLLFELYQSYSRIEDSKSLDDFIKWAPTLLKDFDDIESSMTDNEALFQRLIAEENIKKWSEEMEIGLNDVMQNHIGFWRMAQRLLLLCKKDFIDKGIAFRGLLTRKAAEKTASFLEKNPFYFYFVGFNALTRAEEELLLQFKNAKKASVLWDADTYYMNNPTQEAGLFLRKQLKENPHDFKWLQTNFEKEKEFTFVSVTKQVNQAKYIGNLLSSFDEKKRQQTAIVLGDEQLLPAVLNALPKDVKKINISMGLPLKSIPISSFFKSVFQLYVNQEKWGRQQDFYFKDVINIIENPSLKKYFQPQGQLLLNKIINENIVFVNHEQIAETIPSLTSLFLPNSSPREFLSHLTNWISLFYEQNKMMDMESEYLFRLRSVFVQLKDAIDKQKNITSFSLLFKIYQQILHTEKVNFLGEPLVGLQLLGVLETRLLDFKHIILSGVNEGVFPLGRKENTFMPYEVRKGAGLNTFLENDAIYAYHFYRLIQRCESAHFIYNTDTEGLGKGEMSRFLLQLEMESPHNIKKLVANPFNESSETPLLQIQKTPTVLKALDFWAQKISPSSLASYLRNPLDFYQKYILKIRDERQVEEIAGNQTIGTIVHDTLEDLYSPFLNKILTKEDFKLIINRQEEVLNKYFNLHLLRGNKPSGKNLIIVHVAKSMVNHVLNKDAITAQKNELIIKSLEQDFFTKYTLSNGKEIGFFGKIDRIDSVNGQVRVIDYKTGKFEDTYIKISEKKISSFATNKNDEKSIQLLIYALMYLDQHPSASVSAGIYPLRYPNKEVGLFSILGEETLTKETLLPLMESLEELIINILSPNSVFEEVEA